MKAELSRDFVFDFFFFFFFQLLFATFSILRTLLLTNDNSSEEFFSGIAFVLCSFLLVLWLQSNPREVCWEIEISCISIFFFGQGNTFPD